MTEPPNLSKILPDNISRRNIFIALPAWLLAGPVTAFPQQQQSAQGVSWNDEFVKNLTALPGAGFPAIDDALLNRIRDSFRNPESDEILPAFLLAAGGDWDFLLLVWCVSESRQLRAMIYLMHRSMRDKVNLGRDFDFAARLRLFSETEKLRRLEEMKWVDAELKSLGGMLAAAAQKVDVGWAKAIREIVGAAP